MPGHKRGNPLTKRQYGAHDDGDRAVVEEMKKRHLQCVGERIQPTDSDLDPYSHLYSDSYSDSNSERSGGIQLVKVDAQRTMNIPRHDRRRRRNKGDFREGPCLGDFKTALLLRTRFILPRTWPSTRASLRAGLAHYSRAADRGIHGRQKLKKNEHVQHRIASASKIVPHTEIVSNTNNHEYRNCAEHKSSRIQKLQHVRIALGFEKHAQENNTQRFGSRNSHHTSRTIQFGREY